MSFSLSQLFQMKYQSGENENKLDLFNLNKSASYDVEADERRLSNISSSIRTTAIPRLSLQVSAIHDPYNPVTGDLDLLGARLINLSVNTSFSLAGRTAGYSAQPTAAAAVGVPMTPARTGGAGGWNLSVGHSYSESRTLTSKSISHWITTSASADLTRNWKVDYSQNYDIRRKVIVDRALHIIRDMRCWQAEFTWYPNGARSGYFFKIFLKQIPDVKLEKDASPLEDTFRGGQSYF
jgi:lipopolysaccharide assembly outer membrane protein LptD (OstA)